MIRRRAVRVPSADHVTHLRDVRVTHAQTFLILAQARSVLRINQHLRPPQTPSDLTRPQCLQWIWANDLSIHKPKSFRALMRKAEIPDAQVCSATRLFRQTKGYQADKVVVRPSSAKPHTPCRRIPTPA
jgi:hypothetical protein